MLVRCDVSRDITRIEENLASVSHKGNALIEHSITPALTQGFAEKLAFDGFLHEAPDAN